MHPPLRHLHKRFALVVALACAISAHAAAPFARLSSTYSIAHNTALSDEGGVAIAVGTAFGPGEAHELGLEYGDSGWSYYHFNSGGAHIQVVGYADTNAGEGRLRPMLVTYRYRSGGPEARLRWNLGAVFGAAQISGDWTRYLSTTPALSAMSATLDKWCLAYGAGIGVEYAVGSRGAIELGYRYQVVEGFQSRLRLPPHMSNIPELYRELDFPTLRTSLLTLGYSYRF